MNKKFKLREFVIELSKEVGRFYKDFGITPNTLIVSPSYYDHIEFLAKFTPVYSRAIERKNGYIYFSNLRVIRADNLKKDFEVAYAMDL